MRSISRKQSSELLRFLLGDKGQDLVEYALIVALISLAAITGFRSLATKFDAVYISLSSSMTTYTL